MNGYRESAVFRPVIFETLVPTSIDRFQTTNTSNLMNWLEAVQDFYRTLSLDDWKVLSFIDYSFWRTLIGPTLRLETTWSEWRFNSPCEEVYDRLSELLVRAEKALPQGVCGDKLPIWRAADFLKQGMSGTEIGQRAIIVLLNAPKIQDDMVLYVALTEQEFIEQTYKTRFLLLDTSPELAFRRSRPPLNPNNSNVPSMTMTTLTGPWLVLRVWIPSGTPLLPVVLPTSTDSVHPMAVAAPPGSLIASAPISRLMPVCDGQNSGGIAWRQTELFPLVLPQLPPVVEVKEGKAPMQFSAWLTRPVPSVAIHPMIQSFVDAPLDARLPASRPTFCQVTDWWYFLSSYFRVFGDPKTACFATETWENLEQRTRRRKEEVKTSWDDLEIYAEQPGFLSLLPPSLEPQIPTLNRKALLWYRSTNGPIPLGLRFLTLPCNRPYTVLLLGLVAEREKTSSPNTPTALVLQDLAKHSGALLIDHRRKIIERFEPNGPDTSEQFAYVETLLPIVMARLLPGYRVEPPSSACPVLVFGPQSLSAEGRDKKTGENVGYCVCWSFLYLMLRLLNPNWSPAAVIKQMTRLGQVNRINEAFVPPVARAFYGREKLMQIGDVHPLDMTLSVKEHRKKMGLYVQKFYQFVRQFVEMRRHFDRIAKMHMDLQQERETSQRMYATQVQKIYQTYQQDLDESYRKQIRQIRQIYGSDEKDENDEKGSPASPVVVLSNPPPSKYVGPQPTAAPPSVPPPPIVGGFRRYRRFIKPDDRYYYRPFIN